MKLPEHVRTYYEGTTEHVKRMAREVGRQMVMSLDVVPSSRRALEASEYAREQGMHEAFHKLVFQKFYGEGQNLGSWEMLRAAAEEIGLDPGEMQRETDSGTYRVAVERQIAEAHALGITGVPAYILDNRHVIMGAQPYEEFQRLMERLGYVRRQNGSGT